MPDTKTIAPQDAERIGDILNRANGTASLVTTAPVALDRRHRQRWTFAGRRRNEAAGHDYYCWHFVDRLGHVAAVWTAPVNDLLAGRKL